MVTIGIALFDINGQKIEKHHLLKQFDWCNGLPQRVDIMGILERILAISKTNNNLVWRVRHAEDNLFTIRDYIIWDGEYKKFYIEKGGSVAGLVVDIQKQRQSDRFVKMVKNGQNFV